MSKVITKRKPIGALIDGIDEFPLEDFGLTVESIKEKDGYIMIPRELLTYLKICKQPKFIRFLRARQQERYMSNAKRKSSKKG